MALLDTAKTNVNDLKQKIKNPFKKDVDNPLRLEDFVDGFQFQETSGNKTKIKLNGNLMPHVPFTYGGEQKVVKDYYPGQTEPAVQVLGSREKDLQINGRFFDKKYSDTDIYGVATEIAQLCDSLRIRGNVLRIWMGEWQRYGILRECEFELANLGDITYTLTFDIIGFNAPLNGKFIETKRQVPFDINKELIAIANDLQDLSNIPTSVPQSIEDIIREATGTVAEAIALVTDFTDTVIGTTNDIRKATHRGLGLIKHSQNKLRSYKNFFSNFDPFNSQQGITGRYENASFYAGRIAYASYITSFLQRYRAQFLVFVNTLPVGRHLTKDGDSLQKIASKYYQDSTKWKEIYDHNNLTSSDLSTGQLLEIPRI